MMDIVQKYNSFRFHYATSTQNLNMAILYPDVINVEEVYSSQSIVRYVMILISAVRDQQ